MRKKAYKNSIYALSTRSYQIFIAI